MNKDESPLKSYGENVLSARKKAKFTQKELADKVGVSHEWICKIEKGKVNALSTALMTKINTALGMSVKFVVVDDITNKSPKEIINEIEAKS